MAKKLNFVYNYIGPMGPMINQFIPNIADISRNHSLPRSQTTGPAEIYQYFDPDSVRILPVFWRQVRFPATSTITEWFELPKDKFLYDLGPAWPDGHFTAIFNRGNRGGVWDSYPHLKEIKNRLQEGSAYIILNVMDEVWCTRETINIMHEYFDNRDIPRTSVIYITNGPTARQTIESWYPDGNHIQIEHITRFRHLGYRNPYPDAITEYKPGPKNKLFLCFNRNHHKHRIWFYLAMFKRQLLDHFYISMPDEIPVFQTTFYDYAQSQINEDSRNQSILINALKLDTIKDLEDCVLTLPKKLDPDFLSNGIDAIGREAYGMAINSNQGVMQFYENSLIHIITETNCYSDFVHVTEKTWKVINFLQPFIVLATKGHLAYLQSLGFKTFSDFWDESYDLIDNHNDRFLAVVNLVTTITTWSEQQQLEFSHAVKHIVDYNFAHYQTLGPIETTAFIERYGV